MKKDKLKLIRKERLSWFSESPQNEVMEKDGFIYFKHWNGNKKYWTVSKFTKSSWENMRGISYKEQKKIDKNLEMQKVSKKLEDNY